VDQIVTYLVSEVVYQECTDRFRFFRRLPLCSSWSYYNVLL